MLSEAEMSRQQEEVEKARGGRLEECSGEKREAMEGGRAWENQDPAAFCAACLSCSMPGHDEMNYGVWWRTEWQLEERL